MFGVGGVDIPANNTASATETITGPAEPESVYNEVYGFSGEGPSTEPFYASATLTVGVCTPTTTPPPADRGADHAADDGAAGDRAADYAGVAGDRADDDVGAA